MVNVLANFYDILSFIFIINKIKIELLRFLCNNIKNFKKEKKSFIIYLSIIPYT